MRVPSPELVEAVKAALAAKEPAGQVCGTGPPKVPRRIHGLPWRRPVWFAAAAGGYRRPEHQESHRPAAPIALATTSRSLRPESTKQSPTDPRSAFSMIGAAILSSPHHEFRIIRLNVRLMRRPTAAVVFGTW